MTIPLAPGPFSFLKHAGGAVGAYGQAKIFKDEREYKRARESLLTVLRMVEIGICAFTYFAF